MERFGPTFLILLIPGLLALGHDAYLYFNTPEQGFILTSYGYIWSTYFPDHMAETFNQTSGEVRALYGFLLEQEGVVVGFGFTILTFLLMILNLLVLKLLFGWVGGKAKAPSFQRQEKSSKFEYNRR